MPWQQTGCRHISPATHLIWPTGSTEFKLERIPRSWILVGENVHDPTCVALLNYKQLNKFLINNALDFLLWSGYVMGLLSDLFGQCFLLTWSHCVRCDKSIVENYLEEFSSSVLSDVLSRADLHVWVSLDLSWQINSKLRLFDVLWSTKYHWLQMFHTDLWMSSTAHSSFLKCFPWVVPWNYPGSNHTFLLDRLLLPVVSNQIPIG